MNKGNIPLDCRPFAYLIRLINVVGVPRKHNVVVAITKEVKKFGG